MSPNIRPMETLEKALALNLDPSRYGTFAKSISAYDMTVSDAIYGKCGRYVCRKRIEDIRSRGLFGYKKS
jgi:hypothetical protein